MTEYQIDIPSRQEEERRIVVNWMRRIQDTLREAHPHLFKRAIERAGLSMADLDSGQNLSQSHLDVVGDYARHNVPDLTLKMLKSIDLLDLGLMGYAALSTGIVGDAIKLLMNYQELTSDRFSEVAKIDNGFFYIRPVPQLRFVSQLRNIAEDCIGGNWRIFQVLLSPDVDLSAASAHFAFPEPEYSDSYRSLFNPCVLEFDADKTELRIPVEWLALPVVSANIVMSGVTAAVCERVLGSSKSMRMDTPGAVRRLLLSRPGKHMLRLEEAADELFMSTAQLRKRLYRAQTSYKRIVLEVRMGLARHYLESTLLSIQEIAFLLDYAQPGPFSRAFKKYYGMPPRDARIVGHVSAVG